MQPERLSAVRGIGPWTSEMFLLFQLRRLDVWPVGDLGVRRGYGLAWQVPTPTARELKPLGEPFRPYRSVAAWYCWRAAELYADAAESALTRLGRSFGGHDGGMQKFSLEATARELLERARGGSGGRAATTVIGGHEKVLRQTVIAMVNGATLAEHENSGEASVHVLAGRVRLTAGQHSWEGPAGRPADGARRVAQPRGAGGFGRPAHRGQAGLAPRHDGVMPPEVSLLDGVLERVTFANPETGYTIARIGPARRAAPTWSRWSGALLGAQVGESLRLRGRWTSHPKYGRQFEVHSYTTVLPATTQGIQRYLGSGLIKGIGPVMAERMVAHFGVDIMHVIENSPGRLIEVEGLGPKRTAMITAAWAEQKAIKEVMVFLQGVGVSTSLAVRIYKKYGDEAISVVRDEPYRLAADVWGIGFKTADTIAAAVGIARDSPERIKAGLAYTLSEAADEGHCYLPAPNLLADAAKILEVPAELITPCLDELAAAEGVVHEEDVPRRPGPHRRSPPSTCRLS